MEISISYLLVILFAHLVGDFVLQSREMAERKSSSNKWLSYHAGVYTTTLLALTLGMFPLFVLVNGAFHWITDFITSRQTTKLWQQKRTHDFFFVIGLDQFIHTVTLILTFYYLAK